MQNYKEWKTELLAIATAEIPNFTAYNAQYHLDDAFYLDPALWEGGNYDYQQMTPSEYFATVRAEIKSWMQNHPMMPQEELDAMHRAFDEAAKKAQERARKAMFKGAFA